MITAERDRLLAPPLFLRALRSLRLRRSRTVSRMLAFEGVLRRDGPRVFPQLRHGDSGFGGTDFAGELLVEFL